MIDDASGSVSENQQTVRNGTPKFLPMIPNPDSVAASAASSAAAAPSLLSSSNVPASILGFFRWALGPKVSPKGSVSTMWER